MTPWSRFLHWLWRRVGGPGMQCHGPHIEPGTEIIVRWVLSDWWGTQERSGIVNSVTCRESIEGEHLVTHIVLREAS